MHDLVQACYGRALKSSAGLKASTCRDAIAAPAAANTERDGCC